MFLTIRGGLTFMSEAVTEPAPNHIPTPEELGFDPGLLREKYAAERAKRLRAEGNSQYQEITGKFAHFNTDPYVKPGFKRNPTGAGRQGIRAPYGPDRRYHCNRGCGYSHRVLEDES
jgi:hypothetical protein